MENIHAYEQYASILDAFQKDKPPCSTNKRMTQNELSARIGTERLWYDKIGGVLWFFIDEGYFYSANFYVPDGASLRMCRQNKDVLVELYGDQTSYNEQWEQELILAGYEKYDRYVEYICLLNDNIDAIRRKNQALHTVWENMGFTYCKATQADYPEIWKLWEDKLGKHRYRITAMDDAELDEMERLGRCTVIRDQQGRICATHLYVKNGKEAIGLHGVTFHRGSGLGACPAYEQIVHAYQEGCTTYAAWIREDNKESLGMYRHDFKPTGRFFRQFLYRSHLS